MKEYHSYGIILLNDKKVLMVCRKDSIGFCEFIKGNYKDKDELHKLFSSMTKKELELLKDCDFNLAYKILWNLNNINENKKYIIQKEKFYKFYEIWHEICLTSLVNNSYYLVPEWGFPKGKKKLKESGINAALRELKEETEISQNMIKIKHYKPLIEIRKDSESSFISHYYIANVTNENLWKNFIVKMQKNEISDIKFIDINDAFKIIRPYYKERLYILKKIKNIMDNTY